MPSGDLLPGKCRDHLYRHGYISLSKSGFPCKYCPWSLKGHRDLDVPINALYKHHLHLLPSNSNAALNMPPDTGGLRLSRLSDQILMDKWARIWHGLHSDLSTQVATEGLLHRALRLGHTNTDTGYRSAIVQSEIPQILMGSIELTSSIVLTLCKGGDPPQDTPSQSLAKHFSSPSTPIIVLQLLRTL